MDAQTGPGNHYQLSEIISQEFPAGSINEVNGKRYIEMIVRIRQQKSLVRLPNSFELGMCSGLRNALDRANLSE